MLSLFVTAAFSAALVAPPSADTGYTASMKPDVEASSSFAGSNGLATIGISDAGLTYNVAIAGLRHITNVAIVDAGRAVELYDAGDSPGDALHFHGVIPAAKVEGESFQELRTDLANGQAEVVIFTTNEPGGVLDGALKLVRATKAAPAVVSPPTA